MGDLLRLVLRAVATAWLVAIAPRELASTLTRLVPRLVDGVGWMASGLIAARMLVVVLGIVVGRQLWHRSAHVLRPVLVWAAADLGTLALVLASRALPSNRAPGDGLVAWLGYAGAALLVIVAAQMTQDAARDADH
jgi:hypothetical protein